MIGKTVIIGMSVGALAVAGAAQILPPTPQLDGLVAEALSNNPDLAAWESRRAAMELMVPPAGTWPDPSLMFSINGVPVADPSLNMDPMSSLMFGVMQMVPTAGQPSVKRRIAAEHAREAGAISLRMRRDMAREIRGMWFQWAYLLEARRTLDANIAIMDDMVEMALRMFETGMGSQQAVLRAQSERSRMQDMRLEMDQMILLMGRKIAVMAGRMPDEPPAAPAELPDEFPPLDSAGLAEKIFIVNPRWNMSQAMVAASRLTVELMQKEWWPDVSITAAYENRPDEADGTVRMDMFSVGVAFSVPVFGKSKQGPMVQSARATWREKQHNLSQLRLDLLLELAQLLDEDRRYAAQTELFDNSVVPRSETAFSAALGDYATGKIDFEAVLQAERSLLEARLDRLARILSRLNARAGLQRLAGENL